MIVYRLSKAKYGKDLSGKGAEIAGGRWNNIGVALLYTGENRALCTAEIAVHIPLGITPKDYVLITIELPDAKIEEIEGSKLPRRWHSSPPHPFTKSYGDEFSARNDALILKVPSAVVQGEFNFLVNPNHKKAKEIKILKIEPFRFDKRLFEK